MGPREDDDRDRAVRDALSGVNAEDVIEDPDHLEREPGQPPAATPDSPNPI